MTKLVLVFLMSATAWITTSAAAAAAGVAAAGSPAPATFTAAGATNTDEAAGVPVWSGGEKLARVAVWSNGTYTVSLGGAPWMTGEAAQTVAGAPLTLLEHRAVSGTHDKLGAFTGVAMTVGRGEGSTAGARPRGGDPRRVALHEPELSSLRDLEGSEIHAAAAAEPAGSWASCGALEQDKDYDGNDIRFVDNVTDPAVCCGLCAAGLGVHRAMFCDFRCSVLLLSLCWG